MSRTLSVQTFTILNGQSVSNEQDMRMWRLIAIEMPAAWTAASLSFKSASASGAEVPFTDTAGAEVTFTVAASKYVAVSDTNNAYRSLAFTQLVSGTNAAPVAQGANRVVNLLVLPLD
jgi:hypothetical protein